MLQSVFPSIGAQLIAIAIMISGFGCINGMLLSGARAYFAMARDGLFFTRAAKLNRAHVPGAALFLQAAWTVFLVLIRTYNPVNGVFGNLFSDLLNYVVSAALIFYILTLAGLFALRKKQPDAERPYRAIGYPVVPLLYILGAGLIVVILFVFQPATSLPGLGIVLLGVPAYLLWRRAAVQEKPSK